MGVTPLSIALSCVGLRLSSPGSHALHATDRQCADLTFMEIALGFDKYIEIAMGLRKLAEQILDVLHVDNVIHQPKPGGVVSARKGRHLARSLIGAFSSETSCSGH
jgi:hypothetical protein